MISFRKKCFLLGISCFTILPLVASPYGNIHVSSGNLESTQQQKWKITGNVKDASGPLVGVSIMVKGTTSGTISDIDGNFSLNDVASGQILVFSYLGYTPQEVKIDTQKALAILLKEDAKNLSEVIVVGYGSQKKSDITGAMVNVKEEIIEQAPVANLASALQGVAAGVDVQMEGGNNHPGAVPKIRIRGERSIKATNDALIVVDGIPYSGSLNDINNDDIQSVNVLKDASATAIYGSRGANGVILITTKRGEKNKLSVSYSGYYGITTAIEDFNVMNRDQYMRLKQWANYNANPEAYTGPDDPSMMVVGKLFRDQDEKTGYEAGNDTDWQNLIFENGMTTNQQVSLSGGGEKTTYSASIGYYEGQNNYQAHDFKRMTAKFSIDSEIKSWLKVGLSSLNSYTLSKGEDSNPMDQALRASPFTTPYIDGGQLRTYLPGSSQQVWNPLLDIQDGTVVDDKKALSTFVTGYLDIDLTHGFKYKLNGGIELGYGSRGMFQASNTTKRKGDQNYANVRYNNKLNYTVENILTWDRSFNKIHNVNFTGLFSIQEEDITRFGIDSYNYYDDNVQYYNVRKALGSVRGSGNDTDDLQNDYVKWDLLSYMGRINYNFKEKYLLTGTVRYDGSSRLAAGNKWHAFPSVAVGWNIMRESFMENVGVMSGLKLRASWGNVGSTAISPYQTIASLTDNKYMLANKGVVGTYPASVPDKSLGWENTETINLGLDFGLLSNRLTGTLEVYEQNTTDLLLPVYLPPTEGYSRSYVTNLGSTRNRGIEFNITTINIDGDGRNKLSWTTDFNIFANRNKVMDLGAGVAMNSSENLYLGQDRWAILSLQEDGIWQDTPEDRALAQSFGYATSGKTSVIGTVKIKNNHIDYEADGVTPAKVQKINDDDRVFLGRRSPDFEGGLNNRLAYKGFDFSLMFTFRSGGILTSDMHNGWMNTMQGGYNNLNIDYWTPENTGARWPKPTTGEVSNKGLLARYDASYLKIRNMTLGYSIPKTLIDKCGIQSARVYATASNLYTWFSSEYKNDGGIDPETTSTIGLVTPPTRSFIFGLSLSF